MERSTDELIREIHQRQEEVVIPKLKELDLCINGNGKPGLKTEVTEIKTTMKVVWGVIAVIAVPALIAFFRG